MAKIRVTLTLDKDVLAAIDQAAERARLERSAYVNLHFAALLLGSQAPLSAEKPAVRNGARRRKRIT